MSRKKRRWRRCSSYAAPDTAAKDVAALKYQFGGYILFARDFKEHDKQQMAAAIQEYQDVSEGTLWSQA